MINSKTPQPDIMKGITDSRQFLGKLVSVKIDRPLGSKHKKYDLYYEVNYGYIPDTLSLDGEELDAYILGVTTPLENFDGVCIAIIHRTNDNEDKLVVVPEGKIFTDEEIRCLTNFQEKFFKSVIIRN
jgi:inorganic pyrophosphatase